MTDEIEEFRAEVEAFLRESRLTASGFGDRAAGDPNFISDLRAGREPRRRLRAKVRAFIARRRENRTSPVSCETFAAEKARS